ncbi:DMT family transporter [Undibacterium terreum]|nr:DMT family transporter [Undibacterium terreum]
MSRPVAYGCLALSMSLVGCYVALSKPLTSALPVFLLAWLRFGIAGIAMLHWLKKPPAEAPMSRQTRWLVFLESFIGNFMFSICMLFGVSMTSAVSAGVIMAAIPAAVAMLSWAFLRERISLRVWASVICAVAGISLLAWSNSGTASHTGSAASDKAWLGNLLVFCAVLCEAAYAVIGKKLSGVLSPRRISSLINLWGFLLMTPMGVYWALKFDFASVHGGSWLLLVFYSLAASVWTVWLWMTGLKGVPANLAGVFTVMLPISATLVGVLVLGETLSAMQLVAFAIATAGVLLATFPSRQALKRRYSDN